MKRPVDLEVVRAARRELRDLATKHPELVGARGAANRAGWHDTLVEDAMAEHGAQIVVRLPPDLVARVDKHMERMQAEHAGLRVTRSDAVRALICMALEASEPKKAKRR